MYNVIYFILFWFVLPLLIPNEFLKEKPLRSMILGFPMLLLMWVLLLSGTVLVTVSHKLHFILLGKSFYGNKE